MEALVKVNGVHKYFTRGSERIDVLKGVNLEIPKGDFLALMGPSGSGKTSLLNLMGGLDQPSAGTIEVGDILLYGSSTIVVFYKKFDTPYSYTKIGKIDKVDGLEAALGAGNVKVRFGK